MKTFIKTLLISIVLLAASGASAAFQEPGTEVLMGVQVIGNSVKILVHSGGCTWKESFSVKKSFNVRQNSVDVTFVRVIPDYCEGFFPEGRVMSFSLADLRIRAGQSFSVVNPVSPH